MSTHGRPSFAPLFLEPFDLPNPAVRDVARGKAGVYVLRQRGTVRYVGSSVPEEKGGKAEPLRLWKTILRHFQKCKGAAAGRYGFGDDNFCTHDRAEWEIAIYDTSAGNARAVEQDLIAHYTPTDQPKHTSDKRKARKPRNAGRRRVNPSSYQRPRLSAGELVTKDGARGQVIWAKGPNVRVIWEQLQSGKRETTIPIAKLDRCKHCGQTRVGDECGGEGEGICDGLIAELDGAERAKNPPKRAPKARKKRSRRPMTKKTRASNPYDNASDRKTAARFLRLAISGSLEEMRSACEDEDRNGDFADATKDELAEILGMWARDALAKDD